MRRSHFLASAVSAAAMFGAGSAVRASGGVDVYDAALPTPEIRVLIAALRGSAPTVVDQRTFAFDGRRYRGKPEMVRMHDGREALVATLTLDDYLYGVVPLEAPPSWPRAMLSAQAIVARTYALGRRSAVREYDVTASDADQHYGGITAETFNSNLAVDASSGELVTFGGAPASAVYSACCGGHTADAALTWGHGPLPYLRGVACTYCAASPDFRWTATMTLDALRAALGSHAASVGEIVRIALIDIDASGRPAALRIEGEGGTAAVSALDFRRLAGPANLKSTLIRAIDVDRGTRTVSIVGGGRGHGVGLCQWGARGMALAGATASQIVSYYYPGTTIALATA